MRASGLWANADFTKLWAGQTISVFGSLVGRTALPFTAILVLDAGPFQLGLLAAADIVPGLLLGLVAGVWVDRLRRRPLLIAADLGRAALLCSIPAAHAFDALHLEQLYVVALLVGALTVVFDVAYLSYLPSLVRPEELLEGNSRMAASESVAEVGAFSAAGWLVQLLTGPVAILVDAISFVGSALFVGAIRGREPPPRRSAGDSVRREMAEGLRLLWRQPLLRSAAEATVLAQLSFRVFGAVFLLFATRELGFEPAVLGVIFAVGGLSSLLGALYAGRSARRLGLGPAMIGGLLLMGVSMLFVPAASGAGLLAAAFLVAQQVVGDGGYTVFDINQVSLRQAVTDRRFLGRVNAGVRFAELAAMLVGALLGGLLGEPLGLRGTLAVGAGGLILAALRLALSPMRAVISAPMPRGGVTPAPAE